MPSMHAMHGVWKAAARALGHDGILTVHDWSRESALSGRHSLRRRTGCAWDLVHLCDVGVIRQAVHDKVV